MITHVAIRIGPRTYALPPPKRHHDVIRWIYDETGNPVRQAEQGFLDEQLRFLSREEARTVAVQTGQVKDKTIHQTLLFSEDLW